MDCCVFILIVLISVSCVTLQSNHVFVGKMAPIYIAAGFKTDCEELLKRFDNTKSIRLTKFVGAWQEMKFPLIFCGRRSFAELLEFTEEVSGSYSQGRFQ